MVFNVFVCPSTVTRRDTVERRRPHEFYSPAVRRDSSRGRFTQSGEAKRADDFCCCFIITAVCSLCEGKTMARLAVSVAAVSLSLYFFVFCWGIVSPPGCGEEGDSAGRRGSLFEVWLLNGLLSLAFVPVC